MHKVTDQLVRRVSQLRFGPPVTHVYNPLVYARAVYDAYIERFGTGQREVLLFGMNPGPWGMTQTGVPFGEISIVRDWLGLSGPIGGPKCEHPKVPVRGFACHRCEVSGSRLWGWARDSFGTPRRFFERFFVANYCPLVFLEASGRNRTPDKLPVNEKEPLLAACDEALRQTVRALRPRFVVGIGSFAAARARRALVAGGDGYSNSASRSRVRSGSLADHVAQDEFAGLVVGEILHPSPASPAANRGWREAAVEQLRAMGIQTPPARVAVGS